MANVTEQPDTQVLVEQPSGGGSRACLYGCLFIVVAGVGLVMCAGFAGYWWLTSTVEKYTSAEPMELPSVVYTEEELAELQGRVDAFTQAVDEGEIPEDDLVLTAEEINALITQNEDLKGKIFVRIEDGQVSGDVSIPTDAIPGGKDRYFNGSASFEVSMDRGNLVVILTDAEVNNERVPQEFIDGMASQNLARDLYNDPEVAKKLRKFESIEVLEDAIVLKVRRDLESDATDKPEEVGEAGVEGPTEPEVEPSSETTETPPDTDDAAGAETDAGDAASGENGAAGEDAADEATEKTDAAEAEPAT